MKGNFWYGKKGKIGALLIHGYTGTPKEMDFCGKYLSERLIRCLAITLKGHGTEPEDLLGVKWRDWLKDIDRGVSMLKKDGCKKIWVVGYSLGAPLAIEYAATHKKINGLCLIAPALAFLGLLRCLCKIGKFVKKSLPVGFKLNTEYLRYLRTPVENASEVVECYCNVVEHDLLVNVPTLILHGEKDERMSLKDTKKVFDGIISKNKKLTVIEGSDHSMVVNEQRNKIFEEIVQFIKKFSK